MPSRKSHPLWGKLSAVASDPGGGDTPTAADRGIALTFALVSACATALVTARKFSTPNRAGLLALAFAAFALLLAAVGVYGVMSYLVSQSTHDIGVRIALGAQPGNIVGLVVRQGMALTAIGIVGGLIGAMVLTRLMASLLFGVTAHDPITFVTAPLVLVAVALFSSLVPAMRAARVDPVVTLRADGRVRSNKLYSKTDGIRECHRSLRKALKLDPDEDC